MKKNELILDEMGSKEIVFCVSNMIIGFGILTLPNTIVRTTVSSDGWISILLGGGIAILIAIIIGKLIERFPGKNVHAIMSEVFNRTFAHFFSLCFALYYFLFVSYQIRSVSTITKLYLFDNTPEEFLGFTFLLVLAYGVAGSSIALVRMNVLFFPIVISVLSLLLLFNIGGFNVHRLLPMFKSDFTGIMKATKETTFSYLGVEIMLFYNIYVLKKQKVVSSMVRGILLPILFYFVTFIFVVVIFGTLVVENTLYPLAELAKEVEVPGEIFERFEFFFFVIWLISLFCTNVMALDVTLIAIGAVFQRLKKTTLLVILLPIIFIAGLLPSSIKELRIFSSWISYLGIIIAWILPALILLVIKLKEGMKHE